MTSKTVSNLGTRLANFWMHGYFLQDDNAKMAKSKGEFLRLTTLEERGFDPLVYRYLCLTGHYRTQMSFSWESMESIQVALNRMRSAAFEWGEPGEIAESYCRRFFECINDDLNMPRALARLDIPREIIQLAEDRETARKNRDWKRADELRDAIIEAGFQLEDTREGFRIKKV